MDSEILEKCAQLEDFTQALYEAQPKTVRERMQKIIENRPDTKVEQLHRDARDSKIVFLFIIAAVTVCWGIFLFAK